MAYTNNHDLATDAAFMKQVLIAMMNQCATVIGEPAATAGHGPRAALAAAVIKNPTGYQPQFCFAVQTQAGIAPTTVPSTVPDANVLAAVAAVWSAMAGYFAN